MLRRPPARHLGAHAATTPCGPAEPRGPPMTDATDATDATDPTDPTANGQPPSRLRRSPLDDRHRALGATMTAFGGWDMPLDYGSVVAEHRAVRSTAGVFDLSHLGTLRVTGPRRRHARIPARRRRWRRWARRGTPTAGGTRAGRRGCRRRGPGRP